jgi:hypothetical protein
VHAAVRLEFRSLDYWCCCVKLHSSVRYCKADIFERLANSFGAEAISHNMCVVFTHVRADVKTRMWSSELDAICVATEAAMRVMRDEIVSMDVRCTTNERIFQDRFTVSLSRALVSAASRPR